MVISTTLKEKDMADRSSGLYNGDQTKLFSHTKRVGGYLLGKTIGEGSFAKVKLGLHIVTGEKAAIKIVSKNWSKQDLYVRKNLRRETKLLHIARHPHIVTIYEAMETENSYYMVTELCAGSVMELITRRGNLSERMTKILIRQLLMAVGYLHQKQIIHRDLKIENLLLDAHGNLKLIDFGLSNFAQMTDWEGERRLLCHTQCGSPAYAAPELLDKQPYTFSVDVWSIGVCMFAMLTGNLPYDVQPFNVRILKKKIQNNEIAQLPEHVTSGCSNLVRKLLTVDPIKRIAVQQALKADWIVKDAMLQRKKTASPTDNYPLQSKLPNMRLVGLVADQFDMTEPEVLSFLVSRSPHKSTAMYLLLERKLARLNKSQNTAKHLKVTRSMDSATLITPPVTPDVSRTAGDPETPATDTPDIIQRAPYTTRTVSTQDNYPPSDGGDNNSDVENSPDIQSITVTEIPISKTPTVSNGQYNMIRVTSNAKSVSIRPKSKTSNRVLQVKGSLQRLYSSLSKDRSSQQGKGSTTLHKRDSNKVQKPETEGPHNDSQIRPITRARQSLTGARNGNATYKLRMPVIDSETQAITMTSPTTATEKSFSQKTAGVFPPLEKNLS